MTTTQTSLADAILLYRQEHFAARNYSARTRGEYSRDLADLLTYLTAQAQLAAVDQVELRHLEGYLAWLDRRDLRGSSRRRHVASIRSFFGFCTRHHLVSHDPTQGLVPPAQEEDEPRVLTEDEYKRLQLAVAHQVRDAAMIELLLQTGMRLSELSRLTLADITLPAKITKDEGNVGSVRIKGKGRRERTVTLNWKACRAIKAYLAQRPQPPDPHLFITKFGRGIGPRSIENVVAKHLAEANIAGASVHSLRHTNATQHLKKGTNLKVVQSMLGHANIRTTSRYVHLARELMDKEIQQNAL